MGIRHPCIAQAQGDQEDSTSDDELLTDQEDNMDAKCSSDPNDLAPMFNLGSIRNWSSCFKSSEPTLVSLRVAVSYGGVVLSLDGSEKTQTFVFNCDGSLHSVVDINHHHKVFQQVRKGHGNWVALSPSPQLHLNHMVHYDCKNDDNIVFSTENKTCHMWVTNTKEQEQHYLIAFRTPRRGIIRQKEIIDYVLCLSCKGGNELSIRMWKTALLSIETLCSLNSSDIHLSHMILGQFAGLLEYVTMDQLKEVLWNPISKMWIIGNLCTPPAKTIEIADKKKFSPSHSGLCLGLDSSSNNSNNDDHTYKWVSPHTSNGLMNAWNIREFTPYLNQRYVLYKGPGCFLMQMIHSHISKGPLDASSLTFTAHSSYFMFTEKNIIDMQNDGEQWQLMYEPLDIIALVKEEDEHLLPEQEQEQGKEDSDKKKEEFIVKECILCRERKMTHAVIPCGHIYSCHECLVKSTEKSEDKKCAICRQPIKEYLKLYLSMLLFIGIKVTLRMVRPVGYFYNG